MTEIRSVADTRHAVVPTQVVCQLPPPPAPAKTQRTSIPQKQNSLKRDSEASSGNHIQMPAYANVSSVITCPVPRNTNSVTSSPTDGPPSPKPQLLSSDRSWRIFQNQDGHLSWTQFEEGHHLLCNEEDSSERHSSDDEFDIWCITDEQRDYYVNQFRQMQPDISGKITGSIAKDFFEKSKLPVVELSKIWQLSDVDKDGALSLEEFCTAMHLVVLRRNNIELPEILPPSLIPKLNQKPSEISVVHPTAPSLPANQSQVQPNIHNQNQTSPKQSPIADVTSPPNKEWTKFNDSPTSSLSSPGMKPVNFDFLASSVEQNPKILHPVALRLSPEKLSEINSEESPVATDDVNKMNTVMPTQMIHKPKPRKPLGPSLSVVSQSTRTGEPEFNGEAGTSVSSSFSGTSCTRSNSLSHGVTLPLAQGPKKEPPPPPPPRPKHNHTRSSSLDLNKLGSTVPHFLSIPPAVPPRISPSTATPQKTNLHGEEISRNPEDVTDFADFSNFSDVENLKLQLQSKSGAFEVYRKQFPSPSGPHANSSSGSETYLIDQTSTPAPADDVTALLVDIEQARGGNLAQRKRHISAPPLALAATALKSVPHDKRELQSAIKAHRERNKMLTLLNNELNQELSEVMEERIALEIQLEHLKPFS